MKRVKMMAMEEGEGRGERRGRENDRSGDGMRVGDR